MRTCVRCINLHASSCVCRVQAVGCGTMYNVHIHVHVYEACRTGRIGREERREGGIGGRNGGVEEGRERERETEKGEEEEEEEEEIIRGFTI